MRLTLTRSGGLLGAPQPPKSLETSALSAAARDRIESLVSDTGFFKLPANLAAPAPQPDRFQYDLEITDGSRLHRVTFQEQSASPGLLQLVNAIRQG